MARNPLIGRFKEKQSTLKKNEIGYIVFSKDMHCLIKLLFQNYIYLSISVYIHASVCLVCIYNSQKSSEALVLSILQQQDT